LFVQLHAAFQQNNSAAGVTVIVLDAAENRVQDLVPLLPEVRVVLATAAPGQAYHTGV
jgi:uncharacterized membrane protein